MRYWLIAPLLLAAAPAEAATTIFNNGTPDHTNGYAVGGGRRIAEDFTLATNMSVSGGTLYQMNFGVGSLNYSIYSSTGTQPSALLASGTAAITRTATGVPSTFTEYRTDFTFETPFIALANTEYWIAFGYSGGASNSVFWSATAPSASDNGRLSGFWGDSGYDFAFSLTGAPAAVPEPASWAMMIAGFGATGAMLRSRRRRGFQPANAS